MVVPEQYHALDQRLVRDQHLLDPPVAQLAALLLHRPRDLKRLAVDTLLGCCLGLGRALSATDLFRAEADPGRCRRSGLRPGCGQQPVDRGRVVLRFQSVNFGRCRAERRAREQ